MSQLERHLRTIRIADIDPLPVTDVNRRHPLVIDEDAIEAAVVDRDPATLIESQHEVRSGHQGMGDAHVGPQVPPNDDIMARRKSALSTVGADGDSGQSWCTHRG